MAVGARRVNKAPSNARLAKLESGVGASHFYQVVEGGKKSLTRESEFGASMAFDSAQMATFCSGDGR